MASKTIACSCKLFGEKAPITIDDPSSDQSILIVLWRETWQLQLETLEGSSTILIDEVISPIFRSIYQVPPHVLALPKLRKDYILDILEGLNLNHTACGDLVSQLESFAVALSETCGIKDFVMVAALKVTRASVIGCEEQVRVLEKMGLVENRS